MCGSQVTSDGCDPANELCDKLIEIDSAISVAPKDTSLKKSGQKKTQAKMVQSAYVAMDDPGMTPPTGLNQIMFSPNFPNGNVCGEKARQARAGSCAHNCLHNCRGSYAACNARFKSCLKTGTWPAAAAPSLMKKNMANKQSAAIGDDCSDNDDCPNGTCEEDADDGTSSCVDAVATTTDDDTTTTTT